jgi:hypothetical protein
MANAKGTPQNLIARHPGNLGAVKTGAHSARLHRVRTLERLEELKEMPLLLPPDHPMLECVAAAETMVLMLWDDVLGRGVSDNEGKLRGVVDAHGRATVRLAKLYAMVGLTEEAKRTVESRRMCEDLAQKIQEASTGAQTRKERLQAVLELVAYHPASEPDMQMKALGALAALEMHAGRVELQRYAIDSRSYR